MNTETKERPVIAMDKVESSQIAAIGHHPETNTLAIQFAARSGTGSIYHYSNFTAEDFAAFKGAESIGSHFGKVIKPNPEKYPFVKVWPALPEAV
ncbi:KTSC domain-containing protein [Sideroxydans lithotrophicus]|uniref:KTSC domain-containing protein n=1 Tax=Sideroxydans lithotrophicus (strain ES-1) TaxID=580332 RepID=D5CT92_SIDLE|nr:KTSC domain-containing protein [Sideroxydans lithotrophicus]ADE12178.1 conserved hypothetical protein [Sideroxydans lithotrophicus ES-1]